MSKKIIVLAAAIAVLTSWAAWGYWKQPEPTAYFVGHTHEDGSTIGAPQHSGGLNRQGCHNASVPYHCHR